VPIISKWREFTPIITNGGTTGTNSGSWRRVGDTIEVRIYITWTGAGAGNPLQINLPANTSFDTRQVGAASRAIIGYGQWFDASASTQFNQGIMYKSTNTIAFLSEATGSDFNGSSLANGDITSCFFSATVIGWGVYRKGR
jgi:hypothetical protein